MKKIRAMASKYTAWLAAFALAAASPAAQISVCAEEWAEGSYEEGTADGLSDGESMEEFSDDGSFDGASDGESLEELSVLVISDFPQFIKDEENHYIDSEIQEKYGNLTAVPGTLPEDLGLPEKLNVSGYYENDPDVWYDALELPDMEWKLKDETAEPYSEYSPAGSYTFVPDFTAYAESSDLCDEIKLAEGTQLLTLTVTVADPAPAEPETPDAGEAVPEISDNGELTDPGAVDGDGYTDPGFVDDGSIDLGFTEGDGSADPGFTEGDGSADPGFTEGDGYTDPAFTEGDGSADPAFTEDDGSIDLDFADGDGSAEPGAADGEFVPEITDDGTFYPEDGGFADEEMETLPGDGSTPDGALPQEGDDTQDGSVLPEGGDMPDGSDFPESDNVLFNTDDSLIGAEDNVNMEINGEPQSLEPAPGTDPDTVLPEESLPEKTPEPAPGTDPDTVLPEEGLPEETPEPAPAPTPEGDASSADEVYDAAPVQAPDLLATLTISDGTSSYLYADTAGNSTLTLKENPGEGAANSLQIALPCSSALNLAALSVSFADAVTGLPLTAVPGSEAQDFSDGLAKTFEISSTVAAADGTAATYRYTFQLTVTKQAHVWNGDATCETAQVCTVCGATGTAALGHDFTAPTCTDPAFCQRCGVTGDPALGHDFTQPTCTEASVCTRCGAVGDPALGHDFTEPTCTESSVCTRCGATGEAALGHDWTEPTCTDPAFCQRCGIEGAPALGHDWTEPTCTEPAVCERCGIEGAPALGHDWEPATCTDPKVCSRCAATEGKALGHLLYDNWEVTAPSTYSPSAYAPGASASAAHGEEERYCQREDCDYSETRAVNVIGDPNDNLILGLSDGGTYNLNTRLSFNAYGAAMANSQPIDGDVRYVPSSWMVQNTPGAFKENYSGAFSITQSGRYTLTVTFQKQIYNNGWQATDIADSRSITVTVGNVISPVPADGSQNAVRINPQTGDDTPILPLAVALAAAVVVIAGALIYRKKKK